MNTAQRLLVSQVTFRFDPASILLRQEIFCMEKLINVKVYYINQLMQVINVSFLEKDVKILETYSRKSFFQVKIIFKLQILSLVLIFYKQYLVLKWSPWRKNPLNK